MLSTGPEAPRIYPTAAERPRSASGRIVVGVDGSPGSQAALRFASAEAARRGAALRIVAAWQGPDPGPACRDASRAVAAGAAAAQVQDAFDLVAHMDGRPGSISCVALQGDPGKVLVAQASDAVMLILGAGQGRASRYCLRFARCPVVFVPG